MMSKGLCWFDSKGGMHATRETCQAHELNLLLTCDENTCKDIVAKAGEVMNILTMTDSSKPRARKANGATRKPRGPNKPKPASTVVPEPAQATA